MNTFIVADGLNTSYIDSLLISLFYKSSHIEQMLSQEPDDSRFIYLQELITTYFVEPTKKYFSIDSSTINEIRNVSIICGWKPNNNIVGLYNSVDYLKFLMMGTGYGGINFELFKYNGKENEMMNSLETYYIEILAKGDGNIKQYLEDWIDNIIYDDNNNSSVCYQFREIPTLIPIYINRKNENGEFLLCQIDIMKKIRFKKGNIKNQQMSWVLHSIVCYSNSGNGNYYSIVNTNNDWYLFSNNRIPSLLKISLNDKYMIEKIKQDCILILYRLNDELCRY